MDAVECGAAALGILLAHHGRHVPLAQLRVDCGVSRDGSRAANIIRAARRYGFEARAFSKGLRAAEQVTTPFIVFWEFNHFVVVESFSRDHVYINDPAIGHRTISREMFDESFTGLVITCEPEPGFETGGHRFSVWASMRKRLSGSRGAILFAVLAGLLGVIPAIVQASFTRIFVDYVILDTHASWLRPLLMAMVIAALIQVVFTAITASFFRRFRIALTAQLRARFMRQLLSLPHSYFSQRYVGEVVGRESINDLMTSLIVDQAATAFVGVVKMVVFGIVLFAYDWQLTMLGVISTLINFGSLYFMAQYRLEASVRIAKETSKLNGATIAAFQGMDGLKASGLEDAFFRRWASLVASVADATQHLTIKSRWYSVIPTLASGIVGTATMLLGGFKIINGDMSFGTLMAFQQLMSGFLQPLNTMLGFGLQFEQLRGQISRLEDVMEHPTIDQLQGECDDVAFEQTEHSEIETTSPAAAASGRFEFRQVTFGYSPLDPPLLAKLSISMYPGQRLALVGRSGSGKSTVAKLAAGLLQPWQGQVLLDGQSSGQLSRDVVARSRAYVAQEVQLFAGTIAENISLWDNTLPEEWIVEACRDAEFMRDVQEMPAGLLTEIEENGRNLSGGQRQRLEIARALSRRPSFLILDEATSFLDAETEAGIMRNLVRRGCGCLIIAHRLSTVRTCSIIAVMDRGKIVEAGSHEELIKKQGFYAQLVAANR